jgi:hypothetical protein
MAEVQASLESLPQASNSMESFDNGVELKWGPGRATCSLAAGWLTRPSRHTP